MSIQIWRLALLVAIVAVWEGSVRSGLLDPFWMSSPSLIYDRTLELLADGSLLYHTGVTLSEAFAGLAAGIVVGVALGLLLGVSPIIGRIVEPFIMALNSLPRVALAPLLVLYAGIGFASKFLLAFSLVVVIIMVNTFEGVKTIDPKLINAMRILGAGRIAIFTKVLLPACVPWILAGIRVSTSFAIVGAIVGEFISSQAGIGYMIDNASGAYDTTGIMVPLFVLMIGGLAIDVIIQIVTRYLLRWRSAQHGAAARG
jgi:NitT/TauT family transport system permease protein